METGGPGVFCEGGGPDCGGLGGPCCGGPGCDWTRDVNTNSKSAPDTNLFLEI